MVNRKRFIVHRMKVVPHRPIRSGLIKIGLIAIVIFALVVTYRYAQSLGLSPEDADLLRKELAVAEQEVADLKQELTTQQISTEVDRAAGEDLRKRVLELRQEKAALLRDLEVYRMMASNKNKNPMGIGFGIFSVTPRESNSQQLKLVVQKLAQTEDNFFGILSFVIVGKQNGSDTKIALHDLITDKAQAELLPENIVLNFKFFQNIDATVAFPEGFVPEKIELAVKSGNVNGPVVVESQLEWPKIR
jgi:cell division protein FtsL